MISGFARIIKAVHSLGRSDLLGHEKLAFRDDWSLCDQSSLKVGHSAQWVDSLGRADCACILQRTAPGSCMMVIRDLVRRHGQMPAMLVLDNGKEFHSAALSRVCAPRFPQGSPPRAISSSTFVIVVGASALKSARAPASPRPSECTKVVVAEARSSLSPLIRNWLRNRRKPMLGGPEAAMNYDPTWKPGDLGYAQFEIVRLALEADVLTPVGRGEALEALWHIYALSEVQGMRALQLAPMVVVDELGEPVTQAQYEALRDQAFDRRHDGELDAIQAACSKVLGGDHVVDEFLEERRQEAAREIELFRERESDPNRD